MKGYSAIYVQLQQYNLSQQINAIISVGNRLINCLIMNFPSSYTLMIIFRLRTKFDDSLVW